MSADRRLEREASVLSCLSRFSHNEGLGDPPVLVSEVIEAFVSVGLCEQGSPTKGTYRSVLRHLAGIEAPKGAPGYRGSVAPPPYSAKEHAELYSIARTQPRGWRRLSALALLALGIGAGLHVSEIVAATGDDVVISARSVAVRVGGGRKRVVTLQAGEAKLLFALAKGAGRNYLFHPEPAERCYKNFVNDFCRHLVADPGAPRLSVSRCRSSFVCGHLASGTRLSVLLEQAGIVEVESLLRYSLHVKSAPRSKAGLRHLLEEQGP